MGWLLGGGWPRPHLLPARQQGLISLPFTMATVFGQSDIAGTWLVQPPPHCCLSETLPAHSAGQVLGGTCCRVCTCELGMEWVGGWGAGEPCPSLAPQQVSQEEPGVGRPWLVFRGAARGAQDSP